MGRPFLLALVALGCAPVVHAQNVEKQTVLTITSEQIEGGILSEITWDGGVLMLQGVIAQPDGQLAARYFVVPAQGITLEKRKDPTPAAEGEDAGAAAAHAVDSGGADAAATAPQVGSRLLRPVC